MLDIEMQFGNEYTAAYRSQRLRLAAVLDFEKRLPTAEAQPSTAVEITKNVEICTSAG